MSKKINVSETNKAIHEFLKGKWTLIADTPGGAISHIRYSTTSFDNCEKTAKFHNRHAEYTYRVVPHIKGCDYEFRYHSSFDPLMQAVRKISAIMKNRKWKSVGTAAAKWKAIGRHLQNADIGKSYKSVYEFIEWFNRNNKK